MSDDRSVVRAIQSALPPHTTRNTKAHLCKSYPAASANPLAGILAPEESLSSRVSGLLLLRSLRNTPSQQALQDTWGCTSDGSGGGCSNCTSSNSPREGAHDRSLCDGGDGNRSQGKFFLGHAMIVIFFNCLEEWWWWQSPRPNILFRIPWCGGYK